MADEKDPKDCTMAERREKYSKIRCAPTTDREARNLERVLWLFREMPRIKPATVLDIGCESGFITRWMVDEPYVKTLRGVDPCEFSIGHARELVKRRDNPDKAQYHVCGWEDFENSPIGHAYGEKCVENIVKEWQTVVCFECIEHFLPSEGVELIKKINAVLEVGGTAFLCTPSAGGRYGLNNPDKWHLKIYDKEELGNLIKDISGVVPVFETCDPDFTMLRWKKK